MRLTSLFLALLALVSTAFAADTFVLPPAVASAKRIVILGDSITYAGNYVDFVETVLRLRVPGWHGEIIDLGLSSETVSGLSEEGHAGGKFPRPDLHERLARILAQTKPDLVLACYGMNDGIYHPQSPERMAAFQRGIRSLINAVKAKGAQLILLTPPPFDRLPVKTLRAGDAPDFSYKAPYERYDEVLADYAAWEKTLPASDATVIDLHTPMNAYIVRLRANVQGFSFTTDGIHPDRDGHYLMARTILAGLMIPADATAPETGDPLFALVKSRREKLSADWLDYIGYTRDRTVKKNSLIWTGDALRAMQFDIDQARGSK